MKTLLFIILLWPLCAAAQLDISVSGGANANFMMGTVIEYSTKLEPGISPIGGVSLLWNRRSHAIGFSLRAYQMHGTTFSDWPSRSYYKDTADYEYHEYYGDPSVELNFILAAKETFGNATLLMGGQLGLLVNNANDKPFDGHLVTQPASVGFGVGAYFNFIYYLGDVVGLGVEVSPKLSIFRVEKLIPAFTLPAMLGVHVLL